MKKVLKFIVYVIDVALMPIRTLISYEVALSTAILYDMSIKDLCDNVTLQVKLYPSLLKDATKNVFKSKIES